LPQTDGDTEALAAQADDSAKEPDQPLKQENSEGNRTQHGSDFDLLLALVCPLCLVGHLDGHQPCTKYFL